MRLSALALLLMASLAAFSANPSADKPFVKNGAIRMHLQSGDYDIRKSADDHIRVTTSGNTGEVVVKIDVNGSSATVSIEDTPHNDFHATIEVPAQANLQVHLTAGNLRLAAIRGDKDIQSNAGNVDIVTGDADDYAQVNASVFAGNLDAGPFKINKGGLFRSFEWKGSGTYRLRAHLMAGNLTLLRGSTE